MERLGNIIRTGQPPRMAGQARPAQSLSNHQGPRPTMPRRPQAEQPVTRPTNLYQSRSMSARSAEPGQESWDEVPSRPPASRPPYTNNIRGQRPTQSARYNEPAPIRNYYEESSTSFEPDQQEDWNDDTAGMAYGDWESGSSYTYPSDYQEEEDYSSPAHQPKESRESNSAARIAPQELSPVAQRLLQQQGNMGAQVTRNLYKVNPEQPRVLPSREGRLPATNHNMPPAIPASSRGIPAGQRNTQPLKPQQVARLQTETPQRALRTQPAVLPETPRSGPGVDYTITLNNPNNVCPICRGAGFLRSNVPFGHPQFGKATACQCKEQERKRKRRQQLQEISNLGAFSNKRFDTFNPRQNGMQEAFQISVEFARAPYGWLLLVGPNGCGKTHLAAAIANACLEAGAVVLLATVPDLLDHLRAAFAPDANEVYDQLFSRMREAEVLVLDDLGAQQSSPWANEKLFQLLNYRYNSGFPTVITANPRGLQATDERIRSRLSDTALVTALHLDRSRDYRPNNPRRD